ncbi:MAG: glycosyltransferase [Anaerohalosphaeraceae bacterium]|nr:glycosyltransferase [Anaerohalosphaeraceae bacterium]
MAKTFSLVLPTRGRLYLVKRLFDSIVATTSNPDLLEIFLFVDEDDIESRQIDSPLLDIRKVIIPLDGSGMADIFKLFSDKNTARYMMLLNDDLVFRTKNWDVKMLEAFSQFPDDLALVYPNDLYYGEKLSCFPVISQALSELLGGTCHTGYKSHSIDSHIFDIFERLAKLGYERRKYLSKVIVEHMHYGVSIASYKDDNFYPDHSDDISLYSSLAEHRQQIAVKIAQHIQSHPKKDLPVLPSVSVIMSVSGDSLVSAKNCLEMIYEDNEYKQLDYEIIIVSDDVDLLNKKIFSSLPKVLRCKTKHVPCGGMATAGILHKAVAMATKDYVVFINDKCLPRCGWLEALVELAENENAGIVSSKWVNSRNGRIEHIGLSFFNESENIKATCLYKGLAQNHPAVNRIREFQAVKMPGLLVKKDIFNKVNGFGGSQIGLEPLELCLKVRKLNKKVLYSPQASLYYNNENSNSNTNSKCLPTELAKRFECDMEKHFAENGFNLCSASHHNFWRDK